MGLPVRSVRQVAPRAATCLVAGFAVAMSCSIEARREAKPLSGAASATAVVEAAVAAKPHPRQLAWHEDEFIAFVHFGPNTFTGREWGDGKEDPRLFDPSDLDTDSWCATLRAAGMQKIILTAKHHDGFCLWPSRYTTHSVASSPWRAGSGDVVRELATSCKKFGLRLGIYLSPADLYQIEAAEGLYGNLSAYRERRIPRVVEARPFAREASFRFVVDDYNEYFLNQLFELLTDYGPIHEVWLDGATPKSKGGQRYSYSAWYALIRALQPEAVIFGRGPDVRWCGNEAGATRESEWNVVCVPHPLEEHDWPDLTDDDLGSREALAQGLARGNVLHYYPAETNTSLRHGWFWRDEQQHVKTAADILDIWYRSVGGNSVFLLNVPPDRRGRFSPRDVRVLEEVGRVLRSSFACNLALRSEDGRHREGVRVHASSALPGFGASLALDVRGDASADLATSWKPMLGDAKVPVWRIDFDEDVHFDRVVLQEDIGRHSQRIERFAVDVREHGSEAWQEVASATTVGYKRILRLEPQRARSVRVRFLASRREPTLAHFGLFKERRD